MRSLILGSLSAAAAIGHHSLYEPAGLAGALVENTKKQAPGSNACPTGSEFDPATFGHQVGARAPLPFSVCAVGYPTMSSLWTPGGERPVGRQPQEAYKGTAPGPPEPTSQGPPPSAAPPGSAREPTEEEMRAQLDDLRQ